MHLAASSCNPAWHKSSTMVKSYLSRSYDNAISNLQLQARLPGASQHHSCFAACIRANAFCHSRLQTRKAGASHQIDQRSRSADTGTSTPQIRRCSEPRLFFTFSMWNQALATVLCRPHLPKVFRDPQFIEILKSLVHILPPSSSKSAPNMPIFSKSSSRCSPVHFLSTTFADRATHPRKRDPTAATPGATLPGRKNTGFRARVFSPVNWRASELLHFPATWWWVVDMMMWLTWWCGWHDGGTASHDNCPWPGSFLTKLPLASNNSMFVISRFSNFECSFPPWHKRVSSGMMETIPLFGFPGN